MKKPLPYLLGVLAPVAFVFTFSVLGFLQSKYSAIAMHISALSLGPLGWIQQLNFLFLGSFLFLFSTRLRSEYKKQQKPKAGPVLLLVSSFCFFWSGPFVMDPMGTPREQMTMHGIIHGALGGIVFMLMPITCFAFSKTFKLESAWSNFGKWTLFAGILISIALIVFTLITKIPTLHEQFLNYQGIFQRAVIVPYMIWLCTFALKKMRFN